VFKARQNCVVSLPIRSAVVSQDQHVLAAFANLVSQCGVADHFVAGVDAVAEDVHRQKLVELTPGQDAVRRTEPATAVLLHCQNLNSFLMSVS
jgi:hypothetical protein